MRKSHSDIFKFKVALEACSERFTSQEISAKHDGLAPSLIHKWKSHVKANGHLLFSKLPLTKESDSKQHDQKSQKLYEQIGKLLVEKEFLKKSLEGS